MRALAPLMRSARLLRATVHSRRTRAPSCKRAVAVPLLVCVHLRLHVHVHVYALVYHMHHIPSRAHPARMHLPTPGYARKRDWGNVSISVRIHTRMHTPMHTRMHTHKHA